MPLRTFWVFNANVGRLRAEQDRRALSVACAAGSGESAKRLHEGLTREVGRPVLIREKLDRKGVEELRAMARGFGRKPKK
jgi:hypothetical protein